MIRVQGFVYKCQRYTSNSIKATHTLGSDDQFLVVVYILDHATQVLFTVKIYY
ncbi:unnamed protein product [Cunninghamella blakesleeana]